MPYDGFLGLTRPLKFAFTFDSYSRGLKEGFTLDQLEGLEFAEDATVEGVSSALKKLGTVEMIDGVKALTMRLGSSSGSKADWDLVFNYCEGYGAVAGRESQAPALLEAWGIPHTFSDSATMAVCIDKSKAKMICEHFKVPTSPFAVIPARNSWPNDTVDILACVDNSPHAERLKEFPLFVKPSLTGSGNGVSQSNKAENREQLVKVIENLSKEHPESSLLVERYLAGKELTVGILGTGQDAKVIGVREFVFVKEGGPPPYAPFIVDENDLYLSQEVYGHLNKAGWDATRPNPWPRRLELNDPLAQAASKVALDAWRALGCRDAGRIDLRMDCKDLTKAVPNFMEVNTIAGLRPEWSDLVQLAEDNGIGYDQLIAEIVGQALKRLGMSRLQVE
ncbi:hypothetical protein CPB83DRAFT_878232 [Crepidotus variabilis]|uniref:ATP-grasp domain-containing protein n=1 Tax=Crepidotus variabilis TaxID=179855 RepID=A0A9P6E515_9AGAR|nr:hypothetical protein CPB83DRAFT_878232 [Crepidotus variabilis]